MQVVGEEAAGQPQDVGGHVGVAADVQQAERGVRRVQVAVLPDNRGLSC